MLLHFQRHELDARIIEGSGAYKKVREGADSDLRVTVLGKERKVENKKRMSFERIRNLIGEKKVLYITGFCYVMNENIFYDMVKNGASVSGSFVNTRSNYYPIRKASDRNYGWLHGFFQQDYADMVSLDESYRDFLFCLQPSLFEELIGQKGSVTY